LAVHRVRVLPDGEVAVIRRHWPPWVGVPGDGIPGQRPGQIVPRVIGRARVAPGYARLELGLDPDEWYPVVDRHPETRPPEAPAGYVWLDLGTGLRSCWAAHLEVEMERPV
jgi:hypothetical protein